jgi:hypothetical protein
MVDKVKLNLLGNFPPFEVKISKKKYNFIIVYYFLGFVTVASKATLIQ